MVFPAPFGPISPAISVDEVKVVYRHESPELYTEMAALEHGCFIEIALGNYRAARERDHIDLSFFKR